MFKVGDKVICIDNYGYSYSLTKNKKYTIIEEIVCNTIGIIDNSGILNSFYVSRFKLDINYIRYQKLEKICSNQEIK